VTFRLHPILLVLLVVAVCGGLILGFGVLRDRQAASPQALVAHLPAEDGVILAIDFAALRAAGILSALSGSQFTQEPEYKTFMVDTAFDYEQDLDYAAVWFGKDTTYMLLRGRFDWTRLTAYVRSEKGECRNSFCRMGGSTPKRRISFYPLARDVMALAVGPDSWAAANLTQVKPERRAMAIPNKPFWLLIPASVLNSPDNLPAGVRDAAIFMQGADSVVLSLGVAGAGLDLLLEAACRTPENASALAARLEAASGLVKALSAREKKTPDPRNLSEMFSLGVFRREQLRVIGRWTVARGFLESILRSP
jgi:hypothetical protein